MTEPSSQSIATDLQNLNWAAATAPTATNENESDVSQRIPSSRAEFSAASSVASTSSSVATPVRSNPQQPQHHPSNHPARGGGRGGGGRSAVGGRGLVSTTHNNHNQGPPPPASTAPRPFPMTVHSSSGVPFGHVPAYLPGSASLVEELDRRVLLVLRDGKHIVGVRKCYTYI